MSTSRPILYFKHVSLKGLKSIDFLQTDLKPGLNILIGKNGAGKSNFFEFLRAIGDAVGPSDKLQFKSAEVEFSSHEGEIFYFTAERSLNRPSDLEDGDLTLNSYRKTLQADNQVLFDTNDEHAISKHYKNIRIGSAKTVIALFSRIRYILRKPKYIAFNLPDAIEGITLPMAIGIDLTYDEYWSNSSESTLLSHACSALENILYNKQTEGESHLLPEDYTEETEQAIWNNILDGLTPAEAINMLQLEPSTIENLKKFSPIEEIRINKTVNIFRNDTQLIIDNVRLEFKVNGNWLPWHQLSDGTKRMFLIISEVSLTVFSTVLIEEPELGIHPHQFDLLLQFLKEQSEEKQIIVSTHSPKTLDVLEQDQLDHILIADYQKGKGTTISKLNDSQLSKAKGYMKEVGFLSDFWLMSDLEE